MRDFPHKFREGEMPITIVKEKRFEKFPEICDKIMAIWNVDESDKLNKLRYLGWNASEV